MTVVPVTPRVVAISGHLQRCGPVTRLPVYLDGDVAAWTIVSDDDAPSLQQHRWHLTSNGYAKRHPGGRGNYELLHRALVGLGHGDRRQVDHINGDRLDNRRENLRVVTHAENAQNTGARVGARSRYRGVSWSKYHGKWRAHVTLLGRQHFGGYHSTEEDAAQAAAALRSDLLSHSHEGRRGGWAA